MSASVEVVLPWRPDGPHRAKALSWVRARYAERHPTWSVVVAEGVPGDWVKADAVMPAVRASSAEIIVLGDADVWHPHIDKAVEVVESGLSGWAIPHRGVFRLTEAATAQLLAGHEDWESLPLEQPAYRGTEGGGITVLRREVMLSIPLDHRFVGWG